MIMAYQYNFKQYESLHLNSNIAIPDHIVTVVDIAFALDSAGTQ